MRLKKRREVDTGQSLAQLHRLRPPHSTGPDGKPSSFRSGLIDRCERLLVTPLREFEPGDLRVLLHQRFYPETLVPLALPLLEVNPLLGADSYPGDLLSAALHQQESFWQEHSDLLARLQPVIACSLEEHGDCFPEVQARVTEFQTRWNRPNA